MSDGDDASSMDVLEFDVEGMSLLVQGHAVVDEVSGSPDGVAVYVEGDDVSYDSPPRKLNEKMLEHGYAYVDWAANGTRGDNRAIFQYTSDI